MIILFQIPINLLVGYFFPADKLRWYKITAAILFPLAVILLVPVRLAVSLVNSGAPDPGAVSFHPSVITLFLIQAVVSILVQLLFNFLLLNKINALRNSKHK